MHAARIRDLTTRQGFQCVAGMEDLKALLRRDVIEPLRNPEKFRRYKLSLPNGILLFGPPGCGKTFLVRKLAEELGYRYFEVKHSDLASPFIHETVAKIGRVFDEAERTPPSVVFFDEMSGLAPRRDQMTGQGSHKEEEVNEFLMRLDGASQKKILVVGATNFPERIDPAVIRSGRMDKRILIPPPDEAARKGVLRIHLSGRPVAADLDYDRLSKSTSGFVCSDIELLANNAARIALDRECPISMAILLEAASKISPSVDDEMLERFERLRSLERW
jgi:transitional endoplasmic reticulum ATPase